MKNKLFAVAALAMALVTPALAAPLMLDQATPVAESGAVLVKQNRGGDGKRGGDRARSDDSRSTSATRSSGSGRSKPRVPGGSGCDDAGDIAEHAECR